MTSETLFETINEYDSLGINQQIDYDKFYLYSIITHSTAIEGSTVTEIENQLLFDEGISANKPMKEQLMNLDLKAAYEKSFEFANKHELISQNSLCNLASILMKNTGSEYKTVTGNFSSSKGELRLLNVSAGRGGKSYMAWQKVPAKLQQVCDSLNQQRKELLNKISSGKTSEIIYQIYKLSFEAHYMLVSIHSWADGNGRMSRLLMNMIQKEFGVIPSIVKKESRAEYIQSLAVSQEKEDSADFIDFMFEQHIQNLKQQISDYKSSVENDTLNTSNDTLNDTLKLTEKEWTVLELIKSDLNITTDSIVEKSGFSRPTVMRAISSLKEKGIIERVGSKKTGCWKV